MLAIDFTVYKLVNGLAHASDRFEDAMRVLALDAQFFFAALLAVLFFARAKWASQNGRRGVVAAGFALIVALGIAQVVSAMYDRPRPYVAHPGDAHLYIAASPDPSFPSDHATAAFAIAVSIWLRNRRAGWLALTMALLVSVSRVAVGTHYPGDVLGGAVIGTLAALLFWLPPVRKPLHGLAEWSGTVYDRAAVGIAAGLERARRSSSIGG